jgi:hypothetical protein
MKCYCHGTRTRAAASCRLPIVLINLQKEQGKVKMRTWPFCYPRLNDPIINAKCTGDASNQEGDIHAQWVAFCCFQSKSSCPFFESGDSLIHVELKKLFLTGFIKNCKNHIGNRTFFWFINWFINWFLADFYLKFKF